jgi:hypothetical protein
MPNFTAGTSFGANDTVTNTKLNALIADATINPECALSINSGTIGTLSCTRGTIGTFNSTTGTVATLNTTTGSVQTLSAGTLATNLTGGTYSGLINSSTGTYSGLINSSTGTYSGSINSTNGTVSTLNSTTSTIATLVSTNNATIQGLNLGKGLGNIDSNTSFGSSSLKANTTGSLNTAIGFETLSSNTTGQILTAIGYRSLSSNTTGFGNTAVGNSALSSNTTGNSNTAIGLNTLFPNTTGTNNTAAGGGALSGNTTGANNTAIGYQAGYGVGTNPNTTGSNNTFVGNESVGASSTTSNVITLGNGSIATLRCQVQSITALSDKRDKSDVKDLFAGLDFIGKLRPVSFVWNTRDNAKVNVPDSGFIAQELIDAQNEAGVVIPNLVSQENPEKLEAAYGTLIPVLVQAIKELKAKVELLESKK